MQPDFADPLAEKLFEAARRERPHPQARARAAAALGSRARARRSSAAKLAWAGGIAALAAGAAIAAWPRDAAVPGISAEHVAGALGRGVGRDEAARADELTRSREAASLAEASAGDPQPAASARGARSAAPSVAPAVTASKPRFLTQSEEFALVDRARELLAAGSARAALTELDHYDRAPSARGLGAEATLLRMEALAATGRHAEASVIAERFVGQHPNSPLTDRARGFVTQRSVSPAPASSTGTTP